jgi:Rrf2 family cysteine metabolism transcriptional repressor
MIGISSRTTYAIAALYELGKLPAGERRTIKEIASSANVPKNFLEQILLELKKSGLLSSTKGAYGGYKLAVTLKQITLREVIEVLETDAFNHTKSNTQVLQLFWEDVIGNIQQNLEIPLSELSNYQHKINNTLDYTI